MSARPNDALGGGAAASTAEDAAFMRSALALAARALGRSSPNPAVGCLIVRDGRILGRGWTQGGGRPHAETVALGQAGPAARGATAYITLEPCAHYGRTPPCTDALAAAGIARVVIPLIDPDPRVSGKGVAALEAAGVTVVSGCLEGEAEEANRGFLTRIRKGRPFVTLKLAQSLDGRIATPSGESRWITGPTARREVHLERARSDAVLVGTGTARADDPTLDVRGLGLPDASPVRVVLSADLRLSTASRLGATASAIPLCIVHAPEAEPGRRAAWADTGAQTMEVPRGPDGLLDLAAVLRRMGERGLTRVLCEGGGRLAAGLVRDGLADAIVTYSAGLLVGADGRPSLGPLGLDRLGAAPRFRLISARRIGGDLRAEWRCAL